MPLSIRPATPDCAEFLVRVIDMASDGVLPMLWAGMAPDGISGTAVGQALVMAEDGPFSYRSAYVAEADGAPVAGMIGFRLPETAPETDPDVPAAFAHVQALEALAPGRWYINFIGTLPECRGQGGGAAMLACAEEVAKAKGCPGLALIVAASNADAIRFYARLGFAETARAPFDVSKFGKEPTEAILMIRDF